MVLMLVKDRVNEMLKHDLLRDEAILVINPEAPLKVEDFEALKSEGSVH